MVTLIWCQLENDTTYTASFARRRLQGVTHTVSHTRRRLYSDTYSVSHTHSMIAVNIYAVPVSNQCYSNQLFYNKRVLAVVMLNQLIFYNRIRYN